jgi:hypothetical protein
MGTNGTDMATAPPSAARGQAVDRAPQSWIRKLIDLSRRNNLLYYRPLSLGKLRQYGKPGKPGKPRGPRQGRSLALHYVALQCLARKNLKSGCPNWNIW